jgi:hypothetical protein
MTKLNATILSKDEFDTKEKEMNDLLDSIDLYSSVEQTTETKEEVQALLDDLSKNLYSLDCAYLDAKVQTFTKVLELLKK